MRSISGGKMKRRESMDWSDNSEAVDEGMQKEGRELEWKDSWQVEMINEMKSEKE
jgi:hypothetical protein